MAPALTTEVVGLLVAVTSSEYDFVDEKTKEARAGTSYRAWISTGFDSAPVEVTLPPKSEFPKLFSLYTEPIGVTLQVETVARNKRGRAELEYRCVGYTETAPLAARPPKAS